MFNVLIPLVLYLSQKGEMLNNQMRALGLARAALPAYDDALETKEAEERASVR